jgi:hypothetical protein
MVDIDFEESSCDYTLSMIWRAGNATANLQFVLRNDSPSAAAASPLTSQLTGPEGQTASESVLPEGLRGFSVRVENNQDLVIRCPKGAWVTDIRASSQTPTPAMD